MTGFNTHSERIDVSTVRVEVEWNGAPVAIGAALSLLADSAAFRDGIASALRRAPFSAYFFETPPATHATSGRPFEFVLTDAPALERAMPERSAFEAHFDRDSDGDGVVAFENFGRDAMLVVPCPLTDDDRTYAHLAAFVRHGPEQQVDALLESVGELASRRLSDRPQWLSTAGMGVHWLHVRLDSTPKYYRYGPYKATPRSDSD